MKQPQAPLFRAVREAALRTLRPEAVAGMLVALLLWPLSPALAGTMVMVRVGNHPDFGRVVFDAPPSARFHIERDGDRVTVRFAGDVSLMTAPHPPRNVTALHVDQTEAELTLVPGSTLRSARLGDHVVIDVFDPTPAGTKPADPAPVNTTQANTTRAGTTRAGTTQNGTTQNGTTRAAADTAPAPGHAHPAAGSATSSHSAASPGPQATVSAAPPDPSDEIEAARPPLAMTSTFQPLAAAAPTPAASPPPPASAAQTGPAAAAQTGPTAAQTGPTAAQAEPAAAQAEPAAATALRRSEATPAVLQWTADSAARPAQPATLIATAPPDPTDIDTAASPAPPGSPPGPIGVAAVPVPLPPGAKGVAFFVPLSVTAGAAAFQRHGQTLIVFDERQPIDLTGLPADPAIAGAQVLLLPAGTLIRMTPPAGTAISLTKTPQGWTVAALAAPPQPVPFTTDVTNTQFRIGALAPSHVLPIADPETGDILLVGTQLQPGQAMLTPRHAPQFSLLRTAQGIAVAPLSDAVTLRAEPNGFALTTAPDPLALSRDDADVLGDPAALTRRFNFPVLPADQLIRRLSADIADAAAVPVLARGPKRREAALTMLSLGMGAEAEALLQVTAADDPRQEASADVTGLTAVAALLAGRLGEADGIDDPRLTGTDEITLWRALRSAMRDETSRLAATSLAGTAALLLTYPPAIRDRTLPIAAETMVQGGATAAVRELLTRAKGLPGLDLARAMLSQASGDTDSALAQYDVLAASHDQLLHARAAVRAVELRLATRKFDTRQAAEALDRLLYAWRGDRRELNLRERLATLRQQLGEWREALTLLRDSETMFPDDAKAIHARLQSTFDALLQGDAAEKMPAIAFVALVDENADLVPNTQAGEAMQAKLADRLLALDLPNHAGPVLDKLMRATPAGAIRATYGARLATLRLREDDANGALAALAASDAPDLPAALAEQRTLLRADAQGRLGDVAGAMGDLSVLTSLAADSERAAILEQAKDWIGAEHALTAYAAKAVPGAGTLDDNARRLLLRLATAAARAGDQPTLAALRDREEPRMGSGPLGEMFRLLTEDPVHDPSDLTRAGREVGYARALPANLQAMRP